jgi:hypothetical protein
MVIGFFAHL